MLMNFIKKGLESRTCAGCDVVAPLKCEEICTGTGCFNGLYTWQKKCNLRMERNNPWTMRPRVVWEAEITACLILSDGLHIVIILAEQQKTFFKNVQELILVTVNEILTSYISFIFFLWCFFNWVYTRVHTYRW